MFNLLSRAFGVLWPVFNLPPGLEVGCKCKRLTRLSLVYLLECAVSSTFIWMRSIVAERDLHGALVPLFLV